MKRFCIYITFILSLAVSVIQLYDLGESTAAYINTKVERDDGFVRGEDLAFLSYVNSVVRVLEICFVALFWAACMLPNERIVLQLSDSTYEELQIAETV